MKHGQVLNMNCKEAIDFMSFNFHHEVKDAPLNCLALHNKP